MTLEEKLALSKEQQKKIEKGIKNAAPKPKQGPAKPIVGSIESLDEAIFGEYKPKNDGTDVYDANDEMKRIQERYEHGAKVDCSNIKIPKPILQSIINNPLNMPSADPKMDAFTEKLRQAMPESINRSYEIQNKLEKQEKKPLVENAQRSHGSGIDYEMIKLIVENAVEKKLDSLKKTLLTESQSTGSGSTLKAMKLGEKFLFLDESGNVFECQMKYVGKNKKKPKN